MTSPRNGADAICAALKDAGVDVVFGVPGTQTLLLYDALRRSGLRTVTPTHELAATFMAQGYFRASGRLAAVSTIPGPGFSFSLAALPEASLDSAALVLLTGQPPVCAQGRRRSQSIDQATMAGPVVKEVIHVSAAGEAGNAVRKACALATSGEPGPVLVQVAAKVYGEAITTPLENVAPGLSQSVTEGDAMQAAINFALTAKRVLIYAGQGSADIASEIRRTVDALGAVIATTPSGRGIVPEDDDRLLPLDATGDLEAFNRVAAECDAILVLGAALAENGTVGFGLEFPVDRLVRVDISDAVLATPPSARFAVKASCREFVAVLLNALAARSSSRAGIDAGAARALRVRLQDRRIGGTSDARIGGGQARTFFEELRRAVPSDGCLVLDSGMHQLLARRHFVVMQPRGLLFPTDFQSMAFGLPAAIGAKIAQPARAVVALIGDGGFAMTGLEVKTAVRLGISLPVIVFDDQALGLIRLDQLLSFGHAHATDLARLDYEAMAAAIGCAYASARADDIKQEVEAALQRSGPTLIVVPVGDAPALKRFRQRHFIKRTISGLLGPRVVSALRRLYRGGGS